jgi:hypothetical protein
VATLHGDPPHLLGEVPDVHLLPSARLVHLDQPPPSRGQVRL